MWFGGWDTQLGCPLSAHDDKSWVWSDSCCRKDVMLGVCNLEGFPVSLALWLLLHSAAVTVEVLNQIFHTMKI